MCYFITMNQEIISVKISDITTNPYQPRRTFDKKGIEELAESIKENGLLQPIILRKGKLVGYELLAGERRLQACKHAKLTYIPAIIRQYTDQEMMTLSILENIQREDMNPIDEAFAVKNILDKTKLTHEDISKILGKSRSYITNLIRILKLPDSVLDALKENKITLAHARTLLAEDNQKIQIQLFNLILTENLSIRELESRIYKKNNIKKTSITSSDGSTDIYTKEIEEKLKKVFGSDLKIKEKQNHSGKVEIPFSSLDELNQIIDQLTK